MKILLCNQRKRALTLIELCVVIAVITIFALMFVSGLSPEYAKDRALGIQCVNNLKEIGMAERIWAGDHGDKYSFQVAETNGGTMEFTTGPNAWRHFQILSNEIGIPKVFLCPADDLPTVAATNFNFIRNSNLSYFVGLDSTQTDPQGLYSGDCNLTNGTPIKNGILELTTNRPAGWTAGTHVKVGNVALSDGSVQQVSITGLRQGVANSGAFTNHLQMPVIP
jgi:competence protein ComGC